MLIEVIILFCIGTLGMLLSTLTGGGTNVILVPLLILIYHLPPGEAIGTAFFALTAGSVTAAFGFLRKGKARMKDGVMLGVLTVPGIILGTVLSTFLQEEFFKVALGLVIIVLSYLIARGKDDKMEISSVKGSDASLKIRNLWLSSTMFVVVGFFIGFFGQGGGLLLLPVMQFAGFTFIQTLGTLRIIAIIIGAIAFGSRFAISQVNLYMAIVLAFGAIFGGIVGVKTATSVKSGILRFTAAVLIAFLGIALIAETLL